MTYTDQVVNQGKLTAGASVCLLSGISQVPVVHAALRLVRSRSVPAEGCLSGREDGAES